MSHCKRTRGNRDKWRGVGDVMEIGWTLKWKRYSRGWRSGTDFVRDSLVIVSNSISQFIHVYLDDIFIFSCSIEEHEKHLGIIFQWLRDHHLFLSKSKVDLYLKRLKCLSHIIDDWGIHADANKMQHIHEWRHPLTFNNVTCFLGLVQYLAHYMPDTVTHKTESMFGAFWLFIK